MNIVRRGRVELPPALAEVETVTSMRILEVTINADLRVTFHVSDVLALGSESLHALRILKSNGLANGALQVVAGATAVARLTYATHA